MPSSNSCPDRPQTEDDLDFSRKPMVRWFRPTELVRTGTEALLSSLFGAYADWREVQALRAHDRSLKEKAEESDILRTVPTDGADTNEWYDLSDTESLWVDYTADLGDGFNPTHTVARLLAERRLAVDGHETERGRLLVMGGDQVYPAASRRAYRDRLVGPYRAALPCVTEEAPPYLFAVPGNHDWYDGLTSFLRLFTQHRWIGGWKTQQLRSYFAIKLPHDWWLWGIDVQLESDIDEPQLNYFRSIASADSIMPAGSKVILCTPEPAWVYAETKGKHAYRNLGYFEDTILSENDHELKVGLAGDLHTYARYAEADTNQQRFIAGGGGAYLYPTHTLPDTLDVEPPHGNQSRFSLQQDRDSDTGDSVFPTRSRSRGLSWKALLLPFKNPTFGLFVAALYLLFAWLLESSTIITVLSPLDSAPPAIEKLPSLLESMAASGSLGGVVGSFFDAIKHTPSATVLVVVLLGGLIAFTDVKSKVGGIVVGALHTAAHLLLAIALMWGLAHLNFEVLDPRTDLALTADAIEHAVLFTIEMFIAGGFLGGILMGAYLLLANRLLGAHANEVFSCQHISHYKNFLRLHIDEDGGLTMYPLGVPTVETDWSLCPDGRPQDPWFESNGELVDRGELIEPPIKVD